MLVRVRMGSTWSVSWAKGRAPARGARGTSGLVHGFSCGKSFIRIRIKTRLDSAFSTGEP